MPGVSRRGPSLEERLSLQLTVRSVWLNGQETKLALTIIEAPAGGTETSHAGQTLVQVFVRRKIGLLRRPWGMRMATAEYHHKQLDAGILGGVDNLLHRAQMRYHLADY